MEPTKLQEVYTGPLSMGAAISGDGVYRYDLIRDWRTETDGVFETPHYALLIGLNPSTADHKIDDPTIRREADFARAWGHNMLVKCNLFGFRATDPQSLRDMIDGGGDPIGQSNDEILLWWARDAAIILACWGAGVDGYLYNTPYSDRDVVLRAKLRAAGLASKLHHLGTTKGGYPRHPLYLPKGLTPIRWGDA